MTFTTIMLPARGSELNGRCNTGTFSANSPSQAAEKAFAATAGWGVVLVTDGHFTNAYRRVTETITKVVTA